MSSLEASLADTPPVERQVAGDMIRRALPVTPVLILLAGLVWGVDGALSAAYGLAIVLANFALAAALLSWAGRRSMALLMGAALFGYLLRLALVAAAVLAVKDQSWIKLVPLGLTIIVTHLGLLFWETSRVSATLAFPGLKPDEKAV
ncbi:MAG TPA: ATP synthase subunit I [Chloroflexota bacterium]|nr:ATP synthase subunit I [Chloroflexota bacterium]